MTTAVAAVQPGIYLAKAKLILMHDIYADLGSTAPVAYLTCLRWLGTRNELMQMARENRRKLGKPKYARLMEMLADCSAGESDHERQ